MNDRTTTHPEGEPPMTTTEDQRTEIERASDAAVRKIRRGAYIVLAALILGLTANAIWTARQPTQYVSQAEVAVWCVLIVVVIGVNYYVSNRADNKIKALRRDAAN